MGGMDHLWLYVHKMYENYLKHGLLLGKLESPFFPSHIHFNGIELALSMQIRFMVRKSEQCLYMLLKWRKNKFEWKCYDLWFLSEILTSMLQPSNQSSILLFLLSGCCLSKTLMSYKENLHRMEDTWHSHINVQSCLWNLKVLMHYFLEIWSFQVI